MNKRMYQTPKIETIVLSAENMLCVSGGIKGWKLQQYTSDDDDWSDAQSSNLVTTTSFNR